MPESRSPRPKRLLLIELNEINFDVAKTYVDKLGLAAFGRLVAGRSILTSAEANYEELEPWIQWPSVHSGLSSAEHGIFRLGDMVGTRVPQMFEQLEQQGLRVGCISPMNAENRLRAPAYFVPDPWTQTSSDGSWWSRSLAAAIAQVVNDNAQGRIEPKHALRLAMGLLRFARPSHYGLYVQLARSIRGAPWRKALLLDLFLHDLHWHLFRTKAPDFSTVFFNAGAHIQHHYFFNSSAVQQEGLRNPTWYVKADVDPVAEMLHVYDHILADYLELPDVAVIVATGLSQRPYDRVKFYYRLKSHSAFLDVLGVAHRAVLPRMTRDFLVQFENDLLATTAAEQLAKVKVVENGEPLFGVVERRGDELFVTLTYPHEIRPDLMIELDGRRLPLAPHVAFVAIKNGMHQSKGFAYFTPGLERVIPPDGAHVKALYGTIMQFFGGTQGSAAVYGRQ